MNIFEDMYYSYKLRITLDKDYKNLPRTSCCDAFFIEDTEICSVCGNETLAICPQCGGSGDIIGTVRSDMIDIPYKKCPKCFGSGKINIDAL